MALDDRPPATEPGPMFVHLNAGKELRATDADAGALDLTGVHVVLDDGVRAARAGTELDPAALRDRGIVAVSITAWGYDADDPGDPADELLVQAASGMVPATIDDGRPYRFPGWQSQYLAGGFAVAGALTALADAGRGHHVEVSWVGAILTGVEAGICAHLHVADQPPAPPSEDGRDRQAGFQVGAFPAGVFRCADGHVIPGTVRPVDWQLQCEVYERPDLLADERFTARLRFANRDALRAELQPWYDAHGKRDIFGRALAKGWALGMVMTAQDALEDPHLAARGFLDADGTVGRPWLVRPPDVEDEATPSPAASGPPPRPPRLEGLKVLELTWAWAGPFVGRWLGAYGADVVRIEAGRYPDGWRTRLKWKQAGVPIPEGVDPEDATYDAAALHNSLNRNKRSLGLDLTTPAGRDLFLELLAEADLLVLNMSYSMLADRGIEAEVEAAVGRGLVVLNMPSLGATGPYRDMPGYGILIEGMGGFAARYGTRDEGARSTNTYYPDLVAGLHGTIAALSGLAAKEATGRGRLIDLSQQEVTWLQFGEALALRAAEGREVDRLGDGEPGRVPSTYLPCAGGRWAAVVGPPGDTADRHRDRDRDRDQVEAELAAWSATRPVEEVVDALRARGWKAAPALSYRAARPDLEARGLIERLDHPVTGDRPYLALPIRIDGAPWRSRRPAACFAQHTDDVLHDWVGIDPARLAGLRAQGVVGTTPPARRR
jgi:crotonobetainyl-CoA:carnitine CoA-transferase CaiB-like acyl-CoA transferase